jgi:hypothetical protein
MRVTAPVSTQETAPVTTPGPLLFLMRRPATGGVGACGVDGGNALLDVNDLPFLIHDERGAVRHAVLGHQDAISGRHFTVEEVAQQWE